uniref:BICD family-like cargo adapter 1 n=4 Tax=Poecilia TaxID=8080 RepID=A0A3B3URT1_9TELE
MELAKCKIDIMSLNSQLLDAIQQKLNLSQQLEAWQDDMHRVIDQQLMDKHQDEWRSVHAALSGSSRSQSPRRARRVSERDKRLFSFFKKN